MGRGRAKAKQTKVARELKYFSPDTDLTALQRELSTEGDAPQWASQSEDDGDLEEDLTEDDAHGAWSDYSEDTRTSRAG
jgi:hypothetical protein